MIPLFEIDRERVVGSCAYSFLRPVIPQHGSDTLTILTSPIFVTELIDPEDPLLGFVVEQVRALRADGEVVVIANEARNVRPTSTAS